MTRNSSVLYRASMMLSGGAPEGWDPQASEEAYAPDWKVFIGSLRETPKGAWPFQECKLLSARNHAFSAVCYRQWAQWCDWYAEVTCLALSFSLKHSIPEQGSISNSLSETQNEADSSRMIAFVVKGEARSGRQLGAGRAMCQGRWVRRAGHKGVSQRGERRTRSHRDQLSLQIHEAGDQSLQQLIVLRETYYMLITAKCENLDSQ